MIVPPTPRAQSSATVKARRRTRSTSSSDSDRTPSMCRAIASRSSSNPPSASHPARGKSPSARDRITAPDSASRKTPSGPTNLRAFHSTGLWLAVITIAPPAPWCSTASCAVGVGINPQSITPHPTDCSPARAAARNIGPDVRASRASNTLSWPDCSAITPMAAAKRLTTSGVRSLPTMPRTPEMPTIRVSLTLFSTSRSVGVGNLKGNGTRGQRQVSQAADGPGHPPPQAPRGRLGLVAVPGAL